MLIKKAETHANLPHNSLIPNSTDAVDRMCLTVGVQIFAHKTGRIYLFPSQIRHVNDQSSKES